MKRKSPSVRPASSTDWERKLKTGSPELLRRISHEFDSAWEFYRQTISAEEIERANLRDLDWTEYYRVMHGDRELFDVFLSPDRFVQTVQQAYERFASDREELFLSGMAFQHAVLFFLNGLRHPDELMSKIRAGDDEALFDFAKVDKTIIGHRYAQKRIRIAQISGDSKFFKKLATALEHNPRNREFKVHKRNYLLRLIAQCATEHLTMKEICDILEKVCGLDEIFDIETVRKAWVRAGLNKVIPPKVQKI